MKMPAQISPWLTDEELATWVREAPSQDAYKKRLAIWLTRKGPFHAHRVSDLLQVSKQAVWLWIKQYNQGGPDSLDGGPGQDSARIDRPFDRLTNVEST